MVLIVQKVFRHNFIFSSRKMETIKIMTIDVICSKLRKIVKYINSLPTEAII